MRAHVTPGGTVSGSVAVPGDKSISHRWLVLATIAQGTTRLRGLPRSLDVRSTAACLAMISPLARPSLDLWALEGRTGVEGGGSTWNVDLAGVADAALEVEGEGPDGLRDPGRITLDCGNSGTTMRLLAGLLAGRPFPIELTGDDSLRRRPMERVAAPLREMGADVRTTDGRAPLRVRGGRLHGIDHRMTSPSAQVKSAVLLAGLQADGRTTVTEPVGTRDHTERALAALGARVAVDGPMVAVEAGPFGAFDATVPGDPSSAAFLVAAAVLGGSSLEVRDVGLNPTRLRFLSVLRRMGVEVAVHVETEELGEPVGRLEVAPGAALRSVTVGAEELPLVIDEVPVLAAVAAHAEGITRFSGAAELRVKESDRVEAIVRGLIDLGGHAAAPGEDLVVEGRGLRGGAADAHGDHRMAMSLAIAALAAEGPSTIDDIGAADVSFPGFVRTLVEAGARIAVEP